MASDSGCLLIQPDGACRRHHVDSPYSDSAWALTLSPTREPSGRVRVIATALVHGGVEVCGGAFGSRCSDSGIGGDGADR